MPENAAGSSWLMYGHELESHDGSTYFGHIAPHPTVAKMYGPQPILRLRLTETSADHPDAYWGWLDADRELPSMVYPEKFLLLMCSPDHFKHAIARNEPHRPPSDRTR